MKYNIPSMMIKRRLACLRLELVVALQVAAIFVLGALVSRLVSRQRAQDNDSRMDVDGVISPWLTRRISCDVDDAAAIGPAGGKAWWQTHWEPCIACKDEERIGRKGDGGKWVCDPQQRLLNKTKHSCAVLSVGSKNDFSFEREIIERFGCDVHVYDHTSKPPDSKHMPAELQSKLRFHKRAIGNAPGSASIAEAVNTLLASSGAASVGVLKIDCEGCEFTSFAGALTGEAMRNKVDQVQVEIHFPGSLNPKNRRAPKDSALPQMFALWKLFKEDLGFVPFHKEPNIQYTPECVELALLNSRLVKFVPPKPTT